MRTQGKIGAMMLSGLLLLTPGKTILAAGSTGTGFALSFPRAVGDTTNTLNNGWGLNLNYVYRDPDKIFGLRWDGLYANFGITDTALDRIGHASDGWASVWGTSLGIVAAPPQAKRVTPYISFGPGFYYEHAEAVRTSSTLDEYCDPWFGCGAYLPNESVVNQSTGRMGWQGSVGFGVNTDEGGSFFLEAQYILINNAHANTEIMPVQVGYRFSFE